MMIRIVLVDDQEIVRAGLRLLLQSQTDMDIVGEAGDGAVALALCRQISPHVVITTIELPGLNGFDLARELKAQNPAVAVLTLTLHQDPQHFFEMISAGASGYLPKRTATADLVTAIRTVHAGQMYIHPSIAQALATGYHQRTYTSHERPRPGDLEPHEQLVLVMMAQGAQNKEIALRLGVNVRTVARYRANIENKLNLHSRADLVRYAVDKGLVSAAP